VILFKVLQDLAFNGYDLLQVVSSQPAHFQGISPFLSKLKQPSTWTSCRTGNEVLCDSGLDPAYSGRATYVDNVTLRLNPSKQLGDASENIHSRTCRKGSCNKIPIVGIDWNPLGDSVGLELSAVRDSPLLPGKI